MLSQIASCCSTTFVKKPSHNWVVIIIPFKQTQQTTTSGVLVFFSIAPTSLKILHRSLIPRECVEKSFDVKKYDQWTPSCPKYTQQTNQQQFRGPFFIAQLLGKISRSLKFDSNRRTLGWKSCWSRFRGLEPTFQFDGSHWSPSLHCCWFLGAFSQENSMVSVSPRG